MPSLKQLAILGLAAALLQGCDGSSPDAEARAKMNEGRTAAAKGAEGREQAKSILGEAVAVSGISTASSAQAHATLGQVQYDAGLVMLRDAEHKELAASRIALQIAALGAQLGNSSAMVQGYQKLDPNPAKSQIAEKIAQTKGSPDKPTWSPVAQGAPVASASAAEQEVSRVQGEIAKRQGQIKEVDDQRVAALKEADEAMKASEAAKGRESVDQYKNYSDAKKKAADLQSQIEMINGQLMPLQKDLEIAVGQQQIMAGAVAAMEAESKTLDEGWKDVQSKITAQTDLIAQIAAAPSAPTTAPSEGIPPASGKSIKEKAVILAATVKAAEASRQQAVEAIDAAIAEFQKACDDAGQAGNDMSTKASEQPALESITKITKEVLSVQTYKLQQATAERRLGELQLSKAAGILSRIKLREMLTPLMAAAAQTMPAELADASLDAQLKTALEDATTKFTDSANHLEDIIGGPGSDPITTSTKKVAAIAKIFLLYNQQQLAMLRGDKAGAEKSHTEAVAAVKSAAEMQASFPTLPGDLAAAIPPPPPPPTPETPATAPAEAAAPAEADSPDVQAIRTTIGAFLDALAKNDMDGAKTFVQIEPGMEESYTLFANFLAANQQFVAAVKEKFPDHAKSILVIDVADQIKKEKVTVNGEEATSAQMPGQPEKKSYVKVGDQWKIYIGQPSPQEQQMMPMLQKVAAALPPVTADIKADKFASFEDAQKAYMQAMGAAPPTPAP